MATEKNNKIWMIAFWVIFAVIVLGGVGYYAWNRVDAPATNNAAATDTSDTSAAEVDKLGANEVKLTPENYDATTKTAGVVLIDVYSPTCPHCQKIAPILTDISNIYVGKVTVAKMSVAIDANRDFILAREKDFQYVPSIWIYKDGVMQETFTGEKTKAEFQAILDKYVK
jgi:thioredoxin 1